MKLSTLTANATFEIETVLEWIRQNVILSEIIASVIALVLVTLVCSAIMAHTKSKRRKDVQKASALLYVVESRKKSYYFPDFSNLVDEDAQKSATAEKGNLAKIIADSEQSAENGEGKPDDEPVVVMTAVGRKSQEEHKPDPVIETVLGKLQIPHLPAAISIVDKTQHNFCGKWVLNESAHGFSFELFDYAGNSVYKDKTVFATREACVDALEYVHTKIVQKRFSIIKVRDRFFYCLSGDNKQRLIASGAYPLGMQAQKCLDTFYRISRYAVILDEDGKIRSAIAAAAEEL